MVVVVVVVVVVVLVVVAAVVVVATVLLVLVLVLVLGVLCVLFVVCFHEWRRNETNHGNGLIIDTCKTTFRKQGTGTTSRQGANNQQVNLI